MVAAKLATTVANVMMAADWGGVSASQPKASPATMAALMVVVRPAMKTATGSRSSSGASPGPVGSTSGMGRRGFGGDADGAVLGEVKDRPRRRVRQHQHDDAGQQDEGQCDEGERAGDDHSPGLDLGYGEGVASALDPIPRSSSRCSSAFMARIVM